MICKSHLMARILKTPRLLQISENIMASHFKILSLRKSSNVAQLKNRLFVTKIKKTNGARILYTVFAKTSEIVMDKISGSDYPRVHSNQKPPARMREPMLNLT